MSQEAELAENMKDSEVDGEQLKQLVEDARKEEAQKEEAMVE